MDKLSEARYQEGKLFSRRRTNNSPSPFHSWKQVNFFPCQVITSSLNSVVINLILKHYPFLLLLFTRWSTIATHLPGRTDNEIKNFWNTHLKKKLIHMGFDPMTHQPRTDLFSSLPNLVALASLRDLMEQPSLEEQALKLQYLQYLQYLFQPAAAAATPEIDCVNLWNSMPSLEENPVFNSPQIMQNQSLFPIASPIMSNSQPLQNPIISPAHVVGPPQVPFNFQLPLSSDVVGQGFDFDNPPNFQSILPSTCSSSGHLLLMNENSTSNPGYGSSSSRSSHGAGGTSSYWPELLFEEPFMDETS